MNTSIYIANTYIHPISNGMNPFFNTEYDKFDTLIEDDFAISMFEDVTDTTPQYIKLNFDDLEKLCNAPQVRNEKFGVAFCPTTFSPAYRKLDNAQTCSVLGFDLDSLPEYIDGQTVINCIDGYRSFCYSTFSHKENGKGNRYRIVIKLKEPIAAKDYSKLAKLFAVRFESLGIEIDESCTSPAQMLFLPAAPEDRIQYFEFYSSQGKPLNGNELLSAGLPRKQKTQSRNLEAGIDSIKEGSRNATLYKVGATKRNMGMEFDEIVDELIQFNHLYCQPPVSIDEVRSIARSAAKNPIANTESPSALTELVLAESVAFQYQGILHWVTESRSWVMYDRSTGLWVKKSESEIITFLVKELKNRRENESTLVRQSGTNRYQAIREIEKAERSGFLSGAEKLLRSVSNIQINAAQFDANPLITALQDGQCFDLKDTIIRDITPNDYLTKSLSSAYRDGAQCPLWEKSILEWCQGDQEQVDFLQRWCGYSLSGLTTFQGFIFLFGDGRNGKSVFVKIISTLLGQYAMGMNSESLMLKNKGNGASSDIARLVGARLVTAQELPEGRVFDETLVKQLTGGDSITARHLYQSEFDFTPTLKLLVSGNHKPIVKGSDFGFWRRVTLVPFEANIAKPDPRLTEKLLAELPGILNWCILGWKNCNGGTLTIPSTIQKHTDDYKDEMDILAQWKNECIVMEEGENVMASRLHRSYSEWQKENGYHITSSATFYRKVKRLLGEPTKRNDGSWYLGVRVKGAPFFCLS